jgi:hypothetical protein
MPEGEWMVVDSSGYYDASPGAGKQIYWVVGTRTIDFEKLADRYHKPGLLQQILRPPELPARR